MGISESFLGSATARSTTFALDRKRPVAQQVYEDLRDRIINLELKPGVSLSRPEIADFYTVSQTPVRDAFLKLEQERLVDVYPQSKTLVARIDIDQARETQFLRIAIELEVVHRLATDPDKRGIVAARRLVEDETQSIADGDLQLFSRLDGRFHATLYRAAGHVALWDLVVSRSGHIDRLRKLDLPSPGKMNAIVTDHQAILAAIEASDPVTAEAEVRKHLSGTLRSVDRIAAGHPGYF
ncbi:MAG TPA: GntR family transcriptional regulator [Devosiaceae bacterium]|jgi:DNA-binding GntR family transcriptional regulator